MEFAVLAEVALQTRATRALAPADRDSTLTISNKAS